jgi:hypothetical protein
MRFVDEFRDADTAHALAAKIASLCEPGGRAAGGLSVETAIGGVVVFGGAVRTHGEVRHCREGTVIGHVPDDGEAGAAVGAVDERVVEAAVARIGEFGKTVRAGAAVRRHQRRPLPARRAGYDGEPGRAGRREFASGHPLDAGQRGQVRTQRGQEVLDNGC